MMKRRIFLWMGLIVLFLSFGFSPEALAKETLYKARSGDSIAAIAKKHGVSLRALKEANGVEGNAIKAGQVFVIPGKEKQKKAQANKLSPSPAASYKVKSGDSIYGISQKTGLSVSEIKKINNLRSDSLKVGQNILLAKADSGQRKAGKSAGKSKQVNDAEEEEPDLADDMPANAPFLADAEKNVIAGEELLGKWQNPEERKLFVKVSTAFLGAPYRLGGISLRGLDCSAFVKKIYQLFDVSLPRTAREQARVGVKVTPDNLIEGDLVFFNTNRSFGHVGIYIGNNEFVHASSRKTGVRIDNLNEPYYHKRFVKAVRLKGLDEEVL
jgi:LysM repeat protein